MPILLTHQRRRSRVCRGILWLARSFSGYSNFILPFDRPLDMIRTVPNCTSDLSVAVAVARMEGELDMETYKERPVI